MSSSQAKEQQKNIQHFLKEDVDILIAEKRYQFIQQTLAQCISEEEIVSKSAGQHASILLC